MRSDRRRSLLIIPISVLLSALLLYATGAFGSPKNDKSSVKHKDTAAAPISGDASSAKGRKKKGLEKARRSNRLVTAAQSVSLAGNGFDAELSTLNASLSRLQLKGGRFANDKGEPLDLVTTNKEKYLPLAMEIRGVDIPGDATWEVKPQSKSKVTFAWSDTRTKVVRTVQAGKGPYQLWSTVRIVNRSEKPRKIRFSESVHHYVASEAEEGGLFVSRSPELSHGVCNDAEDITREDKDDLENPIHVKNPLFAGVENTYFAKVLAPNGQFGSKQRQTKAERNVAERCSLSASPRGGTVEDPIGTLYGAFLRRAETTLGPGESVSYRTLAYVGPKEFASLRTAGHSLPKVVDLGFFSVIAKYLTKLLSTIEGFVGNWGLAIILLTVLVKLLLFPLTEKSFKSMARMRILKPELDELNRLYKDDREKKGAAMMELYRKHKINPLGGCIPSLLQLPVWFSLYTSLSTNVELYHAPFTLWLTDLSSPDPYFVLPVLLGVLMFLQQKLTPTTMDPAQAKMMMYMMPGMITAFMLFLPAGLCLYMVTNSTLGMGQQRLIQVRLEKVSSEKGGEPPTSEANPEGSGSSPGSQNVTLRSSKIKKAPRLGQRRQRRGRA